MILGFFIPGKLGIKVYMIRGQIIKIRNVLHIVMGVSILWDGIDVWLVGGIEFSKIVFVYAQKGLLKIMSQETV